MSNWSKIAFGCAMIGLFAAATVAAQRLDGEYTVKSGPFSARVELDARFLPLNPTHIAVKPKAWSPLVVLDAVEHGASVKKGDKLVRLYLEKLEKRIASAEKSQAVAEQKLRSAEQELANLEKTVPEELERVRRENRISSDEWEYFDKTARALEKRDIEFNLKAAEQGVQYAEEELRQLEKMYKSDNLVEETEEIVLIRTRNSLERARFNLERTRENTKRALEVQLPRKEESLKKAAVMSELTLKNAEKALPSSLEQKRREVDKLKLDTAEGAAELANLKSDLEQLTQIEAPADGTVLYGRWTRTSSGAVGDVAGRLKPGGELPSRVVVLTFVPRDSAYQLVANLPEDKRGEFLRGQAAFAIRKGAAGFAVLREAPMAALPIKSATLQDTPGAGSGASVVMELSALPAERPQFGTWLQAKVTLFEEKYERVIAVPEKYVRSTHTADGTNYHVLVKAKGGGDPERRTVKVGRGGNGKIVVLEGLRDGETLVLEEKPSPSNPEDTDAVWDEVVLLDTADPKDETTPSDAMRRGVDFLLKNQMPDGYWGTARQTTGLDVTAPQPGSHYAFRAATTSLCIRALIECGTGEDRVEKALDRAQGWLLKEMPNIRRIDPAIIYNNWAHIYSIRAMVSLHQRAGRRGDAELQRKLVEAIREQIKMLEQFQTVDGGWAYYDFSVGAASPTAGSVPSFTTASGLLALSEARSIGVEVPDKLVKRALDVLKRQRTPDGCYLYGEHHKYKPRGLSNRPAGSLGRSQVCNAALRVWGEPVITDAVLHEWLDRLVKRQGWLDIGRKRPIPHEAWFAVAGYYYYYGHFYASECIQLLPEKERPQYQEKLAKMIVSTQETEGSWWDYPLYDYGRPYGTAFALMTLHRCGVKLMGQEASVN